MWPFSFDWYCTRLAIRLASRSNLCKPSARFFFFLMIRPPPSSPLFPYTTLFRSPVDEDRLERGRESLVRQISENPRALADIRAYLLYALEMSVKPGMNLSEALERTRSELPATRSEEHTSELQSRLHLVCRLLLEK